MGKKKAKPGKGKLAVKSGGNEGHAEGKAAGLPGDVFKAFRALMEKGTTTITTSGESTLKTSVPRSSKPPVKTEIYGDIFSVVPLLSAAECVACVDAAELAGFETASQKASRTYAHRNNGRLCVMDRAFANVLWQRTQAHVPPQIDGRKPVGLSERIRVYKYVVGQSFGQHVDESVEEAGGWSEYTMLVYLNGGEGSDLRGGETVFYRGSGQKQKSVLAFTPLRGAALLHGHGHRCLLHEVLEVTHGVKYLLRTDVIYQ